MSDLKKLNQLYSSINLGDFYNTEYCDYAIYRALQRIPHLVDGFAQTQRKVIYTCIDKNIDRKTKVSDLAAIISLHTKYHHGSGSVESAITNLVPKYNNQVPLLKEDGTYGSRSEREASASRYIESRLYKYTKVIFNRIDNQNFVKNQSVEGKQIEPVTMIPIIPLLIINGQSQIGVGYASDILPRDINQILKILKDILTGKRKEIPTIIPPVAPLFNGSIEPHPKGGWLYTGIVEEGKLNTAIITEVPPNYTREGYLKILIALQEAGKIKSYVESINGDEFHIVVKLIGPNWTKTKKTNVEARKVELINLLKLTGKKSENITVINTKDEIKKYNNIAEIFFEYIIFVLDIYKKRRALLIAQMINATLMNNEKIRFIREVNADIIILKGRKKVDIFNDLNESEYIKFDDSYDYLLNMRISNLTHEKILELEKEINTDQKAIDEINNTTAAQIWLEDIKNFEKFYKKGE